MSSSADPRLAHLSRICLGLPEVVCNLRGDHAEFRVRKKVFAYFLANHHGDGIVSVCVKTAMGENVDRVQFEPQRFYLPAYLGLRGWMGLRLDRGRIDWVEVEALVRQSYRLAAPKALGRTVP